MALTSRQHALYRQMVADNGAAGQPVAPTDFWQTEAAQFEATFQTYGIRAVGDEWYNTRFSGLSPQSRATFRWLLCTFYRLLESRDRFGLLDKVQATELVAEASG